MKFALAKKEEQAEKAAENVEAVERELKKLINQEKTEPAKGEGAEGAKDHVVYVAQSRK